MANETDSEKIARLEKENAELRTLVGELLGTVDQVRRELEEWKRGHRVRDRKRRGKAKASADGTQRKPGRAAGHVGSGRPGPTRVDKTVTCRVEGPCACGGTLRDVGVGRRHRVEDLVITVEVTEYECMCQRCGECGAVSEAPLPAILGGAPKVGPQAQAVAMSLRFDAGLPVSAVSRVFGELFGLPFSPGGLSQMFERNIAKFEQATIEVRNRLLDVSVMTVDETGWRQNGDRAWMFAATTPELSVFHISPHRDRATFESMVPPDYLGIVATDAYSVYDSLPETRHPQCWGHVLRTARDLAEIHGNVSDAAMHDAIGAFTSAAKAHRAVKWPSPDTRVAAQAAFERAVAAGGQAAHPKLVTLGARLDRQRIRYLICLDDKSVPLTTNQVERDLRGHIAVRKLSYGTRNPRGSLQWAEGTTLSKTLRKQGRRLVDYVPTALAAVANNAPLPSVFSTPT
jgi:transposase